ncbi:MAG: sensor histidine kinase, partial [Romboutsia sp.]|nr:sensor histidine kinase [Romboutsia sp.]
SYLKEIGTSISKLNKNIYTDNIAINSVLISKMIKDNDINIDLDIKVNSTINMSNVDICIILGNLLDNAIEACNLIDGYKFIDLKINTKDNKLIIKISNNTNGYVNKVNGRFITTKNSDMSGLGLTQIDNIVKEYNGYINRKYENNIFTTYLMISYED